MAKRPVGTGKLDLFGFFRGTPDAGSAGAGVDFEHRLSSSSALFATGTVGHDWGPSATGLRFDALFGGRFLW